MVPAVSRVMHHGVVRGGGGGGAPADVALLNLY